MRAASVLGRIITWVLVFVLGFMSCIGAIVGGGYLAYSRLSLNKVGVDISGILSDKGEVDISSMTLQQLVAEITSIQGETWSIDLLVDRYGLILPEELDRFLSDEQKKKDLFSLLSADGIKGILDETYFGKLLGYEKKKNPAYNPLAPDEEPRTIWVNPDTDKKIVGINAVLSDITFGEFLDGGIPTEKFMDELSIGDLMELEAKRDLPVFMKNEEGELVQVEDIDPIVIWVDEDGEEVASIVGALAEKHVNDLITDIDGISLSSVLGTVDYNGGIYTFERKTLPSEYILLTEAESIIAEFSDLSLDGLTGDQVTDKVNNVDVASLLGYVRNPQTGKWEDKEGKELNSIMAQIAETTVGGINDKIDGLTYGEIAELVAVDASGRVIENVSEYEGEITWYKKGYVEGGTENKLASGVVAGLAHLLVRDMSVEKTLTDAVKDILVGDALGYFNDGEKWYTDEDRSTEVDGVMGILVDCTVGEMNDRVDAIVFHEVAELVAVDANGDVIDDLEDYEGEYTWYEKGYVKGSSENVEASSIMVALAGIAIGDMNDDKTLTDAVGEVIVGEALGFERSQDENGKDIWLTKDKDEYGNLKPATGIMEIIADYKVTELSEKMDLITLGEVSGFTKVEKQDPLDPEKTVVEWYDEDGEIAKGLTGALANLTVSNMSNEAELSKEIKKVTVGDALGYVLAKDEKGKLVWYEKYVSEDSPANVKATGIMAHVADFKVGEMSTEVDKITFAEIANMEKVYYLRADDSVIPEGEVGNYRENEIYFVWKDKDGNDATGLMAGLAHLTVKDFGNEEAVSNAVKDLAVGDAMCYKKVDTVWYKEYFGKNDVRNVPLTGIVKAIADDKVGEMDERVKTVTLAEVAELIAVDAEGKVLESVDPKTYEGIWYEEYYGKDHSKNKPTTGLMAGLAHLTMEDLRSSASIKAAVDEIATGDAMGYKKVNGDWYEKYYGKDDPQNKPLTGLVKNIADSPIMNLNADIQSMRFGSVAGLVPVDASGSVIENADLATYTGTITWYEEGYVKGGTSNVEASGINAALANLTVENMANEAELSAAIQNVTVADAMNYTEVSEGKYEDKNHNEVTGFMAVIAPVRVENIKETLDEAQIGEFMGYKKDGSVWKAKGTADTWVAVDSLMQKVSEKKMGELDGLLNELVLSDVIETRTGLLALVDKPGEEPTKIKDLDKKLSAMFTKKTTAEGGITIGELKGKNLVPQSIDSHFDSYTFAAFMELAAEKVKAPTTNS